MCEQETGKTMRKMTSDFKNPNYGAIDKGERGPKKDKVARTKVTLSAEEKEAFQVGVLSLSRRGHSKSRLAPDSPTTVHMVLDTPASVH